MIAPRIAAGMIALATAFALAGCDSLVNTPCTAGFGSRNGTCVALPVDGGPHDLPVIDARPDGAPDSPPDVAIDAGPDAGIDAAPDALVDAAPDAPVCTLPSIDCGGSCVDVSSDPNNCGGCGRVCASGVCTDGTCAGSLAGHIVAIGHDYRAFNAAMARVIGDSVALGNSFDVGVAQLVGTASVPSQAGVAQAIGSAMRQIGRPWHPVAMSDTPGPGVLVDVDVVVVDAQTGDGESAEALGAGWKPALTGFIARGGVVIVLEGAGGVSYRFATGAALYSVGAPIEITGGLAVIVDATDVTTQLVVSPYLAAQTSVMLPGAPAPTISELVTGGAVVFHLTR